MMSTSERLTFVNLAGEAAIRLKIPIAFIIIKITVVVCFMKAISVEYFMIMSKFEKKFNFN